MIPTAFPEVNATFAKDQEPYIPLPSWKGDDGEVITCWKLTRWERFCVAFTGRIWLRVLSFNKPLQPVCLQVEDPFRKPQS